MKTFLLMLLLVIVGGATQAQDVRQFYLSPVDGSGTDADAYRSRCYGMAGFGHIDLRPYGISRFLCASDALPSNMTGVMELGASLISNLSAPRKAALESLIGRSLTATTVDQTIVELLNSRLRAGRDGKIKIWLGQSTPTYQRTAWVPFEDGGMVADATNFALGLIEPAVAWATSLTEDWNCANNALITCDLTWTEVTGSGWHIDTNRAQTVTTGTSRARADSTLATDDMEVSVTLVSQDNTGTGEGRCGVMARKDSGATTTNYAWLSNDDDVSLFWELVKVEAGSLTQLGTNAQDHVDGDVMKLRTDGSSIVGLVNGIALVTVTDTAITGNTYGGLYATDSGVTVVSCVVDNWAAADYSARRASSPMVLQ